MNNNTFLRKLDKICFATCIGSIALTTLLAFGMIWAEMRDEVMWKSLCSMAVLFFAAAGTLSVSRTLGRSVAELPRQKTRQDD